MPSRPAVTVVTRFAPSPTGLLHIGGVRTALFSWLHARHHGGKFILRVEDTDRERSTDEAVRVILEGMRWLGLNADEGPYYQTQRYDRYREVMAQMLDERPGLSLLLHARKSSTRCARRSWRARRSRATTAAAATARHAACRASTPVIRFRNPDSRRGRGRRPGARPRRVPEHRARRPDHRALRRQADLQLLRGGRRHGHGHHARDPRRRSPEQHAAADQHAARAGRARRRSMRTCR